MEIKPDTVSLREIIMKKRYNTLHRNPESYNALWNLISVGFSWSGTPEGRRFWSELCRRIRVRFPTEKDVLMKNKSWI